ncbi:hypothetical protein ACLKA6_004111 [Drosophila palustris]
MSSGRSARLPPTPMPTPTPTQNANNKQHRVGAGVGGVGGGGGGEPNSNNMMQYSSNTATANGSTQSSAASSGLGVWVWVCMTGSGVTGYNLGSMSTGVSISTSDAATESIPGETIDVLGPELAVATSQVIENLSENERKMIIEVLNRDESVRQRDATRIM